MDGHGSGCAAGRHHLGADRDRMDGDDMNRKFLELAEAEIDNPFFAASHAESSGNPRKVKALLRPDAVQWLDVRGRLKPHQKAAAMQFRRLWEVREGMRLGGFHEYVDLRCVSSISDEVVEAGRELRRCADVLSRPDYALVVDVCGRGKALSEVFPGYRLRRRRRIAVVDLCAALDDLACMWRYMHRPTVDSLRHLTA